MLVAAPWSVFWDRNLLVERAPAFGAVARAPIVRGAVTGLGLVNLGAGGWELLAGLAGLVRRRAGRGAARAEPPAPEDPTPWVPGG